MSRPDGQTRYRTDLFVYTTAVISTVNMRYSVKIKVVSLHNMLHDIVEYSANFEYSAKSLSTHDDISMNFGNYQFHLLVLCKICYYMRYILSNSKIVLKFLRLYVKWNPHYHGHSSDWENVTLIVR